MARYEIHDPNQLLLFEPRASVLAHVETPSHPETPDPAGPVVWLASRANNLLNALHDMAQARMRSGFRQASSLESPHATEIQYRYGERLPSMRVGATSKETRLRRQAADAFYAAAGRDALCASGTVSPEGVDIAIDRMFTQFQEQYFSGPDAERNRERFRRILNRQLKLRARDKIPN